jgi:hypothetical protein
MMFNLTSKIMLDYMELSQTTPCDEPCAQIGIENYMKRSRIEARAYIGQLQRTFGSAPVGSFFQIVRCPHDFGTYLDIRYYYDDEDQRHVAYLCEIDRGCDKWDDIALKELEESGYKLEGA